jgi:hypothetical protein
VAAKWTGEQRLVGAVVAMVFLFILMLSVFAYGQHPNHTITRKDLQQCAMADIEAYEASCIDYHIGNHNGGGSW